MVTDESQERERSALLQGYLQGVVGIGKRAGYQLLHGRKVNCGDEAAVTAPRVISVALVMWGELGRGGGGTHRSLPSAE